MLNKVTLTGADDNTNIADLIALSCEFPYLEWAILFSYDRMGTQRYPSLKWIESFMESSANKAIHFCGLSAQRYILGKPLVSDIGARFSRVQLNFNYEKLPEYSQSWVNLLESKLRARTMNPHGGLPNIITQHNVANATILETYQNRSVMWLLAPHFLFDASGGNGQQPAAWPALISDAYCGRAGGLGPKNVKQELDIMLELDEATHMSYRPFWIDMESMLRSDAHETDRLDIAKCRQVLEIARPYIKA